MKSNKFIFIIPLTPKALLTQERKYLQELSLSTLLRQNYEYWNALLIGDYIPDIAKNSDKFYWLNYEGTKAQKMPLGAKYIIDKGLDHNYIIRLDDDDIFNPTKLNELKFSKFDIYVDKKQFFWNYKTKEIASRTWYWFANTTIQRREHALLLWVDIADENHKKSYIIDTSHDHLHLYYRDKTILFSKSKSPLYLRAVNSSSTTALDADDYSKYMNSFGNWKNNNLQNFLFLGSSSLTTYQNLTNLCLNAISEIRTKSKYNKIVLGLK